MFKTQKQKLVGALVVMGLITVVFSLPAVAITYNVGGLLIPVFGIGLVGAGVYIGLKETHGDNSTKPVERTENAYIMNVLVINSKGEQVFDPEMYDSNELKYIVQIAYPHGRKEEYETSPYLLSGIGEGMRGVATVQGNWLSKFEPYPYTPQT